MSDDKDPIEDLPKDAPEDTTEDDPLGIGLDSTTTYASIGCCVCLILLCIIGLIFWLRSSSSDSTDAATDSECCPTPTHYTIEFKYADGVNPYNNFSIPPFVPKPPEFFGKTN